MSNEGDSSYSDGPGYFSKGGRREKSISWDNPTCGDASFRDREKREESDLRLSPFQSEEPLSPREGVIWYSRWGWGGLRLASIKKQSVLGKI